MVYKIGGKNIVFKMVVVRKNDTRTNVKANMPKIKARLTILYVRHVT